MLKRQLLIGVLLSVLTSAPVLAQPGVLWHRCFGGTKGDECNAMVRTLDNGFALAGSATSTDGDVSGNHGASDAWLVKLDSNGEIQWQKCFGGTADEEFRSIIQTTDGGFAMAGRTSSTDGQVSGNHGNYDGWVVKVDNTGAIQWQKCLGGSSGDEIFSIIQTSDGGFAVCGQTNSTDGDVSGSHGANNSDAWVVKLDDAGNIQWKKC
ncbi:MAG TPA: T9SS C-terminal target domain-containing protein, partial [Candidatus Kapabacteria bacterium]|nr:T9SS C-terminal target domain-containing protein [Candidatus Kapabacteria bacterium]